MNIIITLRMQFNLDYILYLANDYDELKQTDICNQKINELNKQAHS